MIYPGSLSLEEKLASLFQPDELLPNQFFDTLRRKAYLEPEKALMLAVLEDAVWCIQKYAECSKGRGKRLFNEARDWILDEDEDWLFSFNNICDALGLKPTYLRRALSDMMERELAKASRRKLPQPLQPRKRKAKDRRTMKVAA